MIDEGIEPLSSVLLRSSKALSCDECAEPREATSNGNSGGGGGNWSKNDADIPGGIGATTMAAGVGSSPKSFVPLSQ